MKFVSNREWALLARILAFSIVPTLGGLLRVVELGGGPTIIPENPRALANPPPIVLHIFSSFIFCAIGALQFLSSVRHHYPKLYRTTGRVIAVAGCVSALTGLWMTHFFVFPEELQGVPLYWTRIVLSLAMLGLIAKAVTEIRSRNFWATAQQCCLPTLSDRAPPRRQSWASAGLLHPGRNPREHCEKE